MFMVSGFCLAFNDYILIQVEAMDEITIIDFNARLLEKIEPGFNLHHSFVTFAKSLLLPNKNTKSYWEFDSTLKKRIDLQVLFKIRKISENYAFDFTNNNLAAYPLFKDNKLWGKRYNNAWSLDCKNPQRRNSFGQAQ
jgi:hypothetical protein